MANEKIYREKCTCTNCDKEFAFEYPEVVLPHGTPGKVSVDLTAECSHCKAHNDHTVEARILEENEGAGNDDAGGDDKGGQLKDDPNPRGISKIAANLGGIKDSRGRGKIGG